MAAPVLRPLSTGEVLDTSFGLYRALFLPLVIVSVACRAIPLALNVYVQQVSGQSAFAIFDHWPLLLVNLIVAGVLNVIGVAATTFIVSGTYLGRPITADDALRRAAGLIGPLILLSFLTGLALFFGLLAFVIPGVIIWSGLVIATAVLVLEQPISATGAMGRSWELTKGFRFKVFVCVFITILLFAIPIMVVSVIGAIGAMAGTWSPVITGTLTGVLQIFVAPFLYVVVTVLYYDLRVRKEGFDLELLATATHPAA